MSEDRSATAVWRRRERSFAVGVILWAVGVGTAMAIWPQEVATWLSQTPSLTITGVIMVSIGLLAAICEGAAVVLGNQLEPGDETALTEVPWDE